MRSPALALAEEFSATCTTESSKPEVELPFWVGTGRCKNGRLTQVVVPVRGKYVEALDRRMRGLGWKVTHFRRLVKTAQKGWIPEEEHYDLPYPFHAMEPEDVYVLTVGIQTKPKHDQEPF